MSRRMKGLVRKFVTLIRCLHSFGCILPVFISQIIAIQTITISEVRITTIKELMIIMICVLNAIDDIDSDKEDIVNLLKTITLIIKAASREIMISLYR